MKRQFMTTSLIGYPRIGAKRELKFAIEKFFKKELSESELETVAKTQRQLNWQTQFAAGIDFIPSNDFSFYDTTLDTTFALNIVPERYQALAISPLEKYFAAARGHQSEAGDVKALAMKKWFNTNYHYMVPEFDDGTVLKLDLSKLLSEYQEALALGITTKPVLIGPYTLLKLIKFTGQSSIATIQDEVVAIYAEVFEKLAAEKIDWLQLDEPALVFDLSAEDIGLVKAIYTPLLAQKKSVKVLLQTYFGDVRDIYTDLVKLDVDAIGLDFVEGRKTAELIATYGFPTDKKLFAGVVNGKNIWRNNYQKTLDILAKLPKDKLVISSSCSLQHVPYTVSAETDLDEKILRHFAFAQEKLQEIKDINAIFYQLETGSLAENKALFDEKRFPIGKLNEDFYLLLQMLKEVKGIYILPGQYYHVFYRIGSNTRKKDKNDFSRVFMDIVENADVAQEIVEKHYPHLREVCIRFGLFQRLDYMLHIPTSQMNSKNEFYVQVKKYLRSHIQDTIKNPYLTKKNKVYLMLLTIAPKMVRVVHQKVKGL